MKKKGIGLVLLSFSFMAQAGTMGPSVVEWLNVVTLSGGPVWANSGKFQTIYFSPELSRSYTVDNSTRLFGEGEIFVGKQRLLNEVYEGQLGLAFAGLSKQGLSGEIWDFEDPRFNNYRYDYDVHHYRGVLKGKLLRNDGPWFTKPWVSASIGFSYNKAKQYREWPIICEAESLPAAYFHDHRNTAFTWSLGAGIQRVLNPNWQVGIGYEFTDWGRSSLRGAMAQPPGARGLTQNHFYTNGLLFNLTWLS